MSDKVGSQNATPAPSSPSLAQMVDDRGLVHAQSWPRQTWLKAALVGGLLILINCWQFPILFDQWRLGQNWSHGFIIPLFSLYLVYARRNELFSAPRRVCMWGLPVLVLAILLQIAAYYPGRNMWLCQVGMTLVAFGTVLYLTGTAMAKVTWLPIFYLALAMPISENLYTKVAYRLQELAASSATALMKVFGVAINSAASSMQIVSFGGVTTPLMVSEACSGIQSLMAYVALGVAMAYLEDRPMWQRLIFVATIIPIAIGVNILRVIITCFMFLIDKPELGKDFMHEFTGLLMLIPALLLFWLVGKLLNSLFVEDDEEEQPGKVSGTETSKQ